MKKRLQVYQVSRGSDRCGLVVSNGWVRQAAPLIAHYKRLPWRKAKARLIEWGWTIKRLKGDLL